jgi:hypothetical protein
MAYHPTDTPRKPPLDAQEAGVKENWLRALDAYHVRFLVLNLQSERDMVTHFRSQPGWVIDFEDGESIIFARADAPEMHGIPASAQRDVRIAA